MASASRMSKAGRARVFWQNELALILLEATARKGNIRHRKVFGDETGRNPFRRLPPRLGSPTPEAAQARDAISDS